MMARVRRGNLPVELNSFIGRRAETGRVKRSLEAYRAVTLTGPGGVGKTRLARYVAAEASRAFADGVWFVELDDVVDPVLLPSTVLSSLGLRDDDDTPIDTKLVDHFRPLRALLLLDGCDHVVAGCARLVDRLLRAAPGLRVLSTSRRPFHNPGEAVFPVKPLPVPDPDVGPLPAAALTHYDGVSLLVDRATAVDPDFTLTDANAAAVARICNRLDGLPAAIEFAADRLSILSAEQLAERLDDAYHLLATAKRGVPERQQTLRALIDSSYVLCSPAEQALWARLAVFPGRFELSGVEAVCAGGTIEADAVIDLVAGLIDKSVLVRDEHVGGAWYRLPRLLRAYARSHLLGADEWAELRQRHARWCLSLAERSALGLLTAKADVWLGRLAGNHASLRGALECWLEPGGDHTRALRLARVLWFYWLLAGRVGEGRSWAERALGVSPEPSPDRATALVVAAHLAFVDGDGGAGDAMLEAALAIEQRFADPRLTGELLFGAALSDIQRSDLDSARTRLEAALAAGRRADDRVGAPMTALILALVCVFLGNFEQAAYYGDEYRRFQEAVVDADSSVYAGWITTLAKLRSGDVDGALAAQREYTAESLRWRNRFALARCVECGALILAANGREEEATLLLGAVEAHPFPAFPPLAALRDQTSSAVRDSLGATRFSGFLARGRALSLEEAVSIIVDPPDGAALGSPETAPLSKREWEVAELVAEGRSNKEVAAALVISPRTVEGHVQRILTKLNLSSRAQMASWMAEQRAVRDGRPAAPNA